RELAIHADFLRRVIRVREPGAVEDGGELTRPDHLHWYRTVGDEEPVRLERQDTSITRLSRELHEQLRRRSPECDTHAASGRGIRGDSAVECVRAADDATDLNRCHTAGGRARYGMRGGAC